MNAKAKMYFPQVFQTFQGFNVLDLKEWHQSKRIELILESKASRKHPCFRCGTELGNLHDRYYVKAKHLRVMGYKVSVCFYRERRHCPKCKKVRSECIDFICPASPHITTDLAWWLTQLTTETSVIEVVATDQHEGYAASVKQYCQNATLVWDKFHLMQNFEEAVNKVRMKLHEEQTKGSELKRLSRGQFRFIFLKRAHTRTKFEQQHIDSVLELNHEFARLEIIKERMLIF